MLQSRSSSHAPRLSAPLATAISTVIGTAYLVLLISFTWRGGWLGYAAGIGDHTVLFPQGVAWAVPGAFENDWFMQAAPQPHWFFDIVVAAGIRFHVLDPLLFAYWVAGLAAYTLATLLLARIVVKSRPLLVTAMLLTITGITPWMLFGTGTPNIGMALPTVLTSSIIYLVFVLLMRGNLTSAAILATVSSALHVQQGSIVAVVFGVTLVVQWIARRRFPPLPILFGFVGSTAFVVFGLRLRPVAANLSDFVEVCNTVIPYHCAASSWFWAIKLGVLGGLALAALTVLALRGVQRTMWLTSIGLVVLGLGLGFIADARHIPVLGELAQAVNVYRLGAVVVPFVLWGTLLPVLRLRSFPGLFERRWAHLLLWGVWALAMIATFLDPAWGMLNLAVKERPIAVAMAIVGVVLAGLVFIRWRRALGWAVASITTTSLIIGAIAVGTLTPNSGFHWYATSGNPAELKWYESVRDVVPAGGIITGPGETSTLRLYSQRAFIADCKNVPYGGDAWREWQQRISDLGICFNSTEYTDKFTVADYMRVAEKYHSRYVLLGPEAIVRNQDEIKAAGWTMLLGPNEAVGWTLYELPSKDG